MASCNVCGQPLARPLYQSTQGTSLTSNGRLVEGSTIVSFCPDCAHLQTEPMLALDQFYAEQYQIFSHHEDEDLLYGVVHGQRVYRIDHQIDTLLAKLTIPPGARVLDYGCAKAHLLRKLAARRPDLDLHAFDVSAGYVPFWNAFIPPGNQATFRLPPSWEAGFDLVLSSYMLEHVADPPAVVRSMARLLKPGGTLYGIVPNVYTNVADFVVVDHLNHFSPPSLARVLARPGLRLREIDEVSHESALIFSATQSTDPTPVARAGRDDAAAFGVRAREIARLWQGYVHRIRDLEAALPEAARMAIYGSGFYGTLLASSLARPERISCFVDRDPFRQGKFLMDRPVVPPEALPGEVSVVYVGLNPRIAREAVRDVTAFQHRPLQFLFP